MAKEWILIPIDNCGSISSWILKTKIMSNLEYSKVKLISFDRR